MIPTRRLGRSRPEPLALLLILLSPLGASAVSDRAQREDPAVTIDVETLRDVGDGSFAALDSDGDGRITESEFLAADGVALPGQRGRSFLFLHPDAGEVEVPDTDLPTGEIEAVVTDAGLRIVRMVARRDDTTAFAEMDRDGDGMLSLEEYRNRPERGAVPRRVIELRVADAARSVFRRLDADGDGAITRGEWPSPEDRLAALDRDRDGTITFSELVGDGHRRTGGGRSVIVMP